MKFSLVLFNFALLWISSIGDKVSKQVFRSEMQPSIINGVLAQEGQFPYIAGIFITQKSGIKSFCGGVIIASQWILTAAHCTENAAVFELRLGTTSLNEINMILYTMDYTAHPGYRRETLENDIALIRLRDPIVFTDKIKPIPLWNERIVPEKTVTAVGWGKTGDNTSISNSLYYVNLYTISNDECLETYDIKHTMLCVKGNGSQGTCQGDSGGPLVHFTDDGEAVLVGTTCFVSINGCESNDPQGFTRTSDFIEWIKTTSAATGFKLPSILSLMVLFFLKLY